MHYDRTSNASDTNKYMKKRGTSKLEGYHPKLHAVFAGNNYSGFGLHPGHAVQLQLECKSRY